jgi:phosphoribosylamine--glycine ligase
MVDEMEKQGIPCFGPKAKAAVIEASKAFSKNLMKKYGIPTADYQIFDDAKKALQYIEEKNTFPIVLKADGLALGKGVLIAESLADAKAAIRELMVDRMFGTAGNTIVVEEFMEGPEVSVLAFTDSKVIRPMISSMDHKRADDHDEGLNTGGMGTIAPSPYYTEKIAQQCMDEIFLPTMYAMNAEDRAFKGCLYFGLMLTETGPRVVEYNCRFGDPETQVVLPLLKGDLYTIMKACHDETLDKVKIDWSDEHCACVIEASGGYPVKYTKGYEIHGLDEHGQHDDVYIYHAGTKLENGKYYTNGGRVLGVTALGDTLDDALKTAYSAVDEIGFENMHCRRDIGRK